jgi:hypothetical protein
MRYPNTGFILINSCSRPANGTNPRHLSEVYGVWVYSWGAVWFGGNSPAVAWGLRSISRSFHALHLLLLGMIAYTRSGFNVDN